MGYHSGLPDNESLAAQQAAGQTDLVTPATRTAAEALAAAQSTAKITALGSLLTPSQVACPAFTAGAASIALASTKSTECVVEAARTLAASSTLTLLTTDAVAGQLYAVTCNALTLGQVLTVASASVNLATFAASLTKPLSHRFFFDGVAFFYDHSVWGQ